MAPFPPVGDAGSGVIRFSAAYFLVALVLLYATAPFVQQLQGGALVEAVLMTLVLLSAVLAVGGHRRILVWAILLAAPAVVEKWAAYWRQDLLPPQVFQGASLLFVAFVVLRLLKFILQAPRVNSEILCAGVATYLLLGLLWAFAYLLTDQLIPHSFAFTVDPPPNRSLNSFISLYFSITTLATSGYGDIVPVSGLARMLAMMESVAGMFYVTLLIARLVAIYSSQGPSEGANDPVALDRMQFAGPDDSPASRSDSQQDSETVQNAANRQ